VLSFLSSVRTLFIIPIDAFLLLEAEMTSFGSVELLGVILFLVVFSPFYLPHDKILPSAGKDLVMAVEAIQFTINQFDLLRRFHSYGREILFLAGDHPCVVPCKLSFQQSSEVTVEIKDLVVL
jgi:hypothetical protein